MQMRHINKFAYVLELEETNASRGYHIQIVKINIDQKDLFDSLIKQYSELDLDNINDMEDGVGFVNAHTFNEIIEFWKDRNQEDVYLEEIKLFMELDKFPDFFPVCPAYLVEHNESWLVRVKIKEILTINSIQTFEE